MIKLRTINDYNMVVRFFPSHACFVARSLGHCREAHIEVLEEQIARESCRRKELEVREEIAAKSKSPGGETTELQTIIGYYKIIMIIMIW